MSIFERKDIFQNYDILNQPWTCTENRKLRGNIMHLLILDFSKTFDTVLHKKLLVKLDMYGIIPGTSIGK